LVRGPSGSGWPSGRTHAFEGTGLRDSCAGRLRQFDSTRGDVFFAREGFLGRSGGTDGRMGRSIEGAGPRRQPRGRAAGLHGARGGFMGLAGASWPFLGRGSGAARPAEAGWFGSRMAAADDGLRPRRGRGSSPSMVPCWTQRSWGGAPAQRPAGSISGCSSSRRRYVCSPISSAGDRVGPGTPARRETSRSVRDSAGDTIPGTDWPGAIPVHEAFGGRAPPLPG